MFGNPPAKALNCLAHSPKLRLPATGPTTWTKRRPARYILVDLPGRVEDPSRVDDLQPGHEKVTSWMVRNLTYHLRNGMIFQLSKRVDVSSFASYLYWRRFRKFIFVDFLSFLGETLLNGGPLELRLWIVVGADMCWQCETRNWTSTTKMQN